MSQKIIILNFLFILLIQIHCFGQKGNIILKNYYNSGTGIDNPTWDIKQAKTGIMYLATSNGILSYDGVRWKNIKCSGAAYSITIEPKTNRIYVACQNSFGFIQSDKNGNEYYKPILKTENENFISKVNIIGPFIYYYNNDRIYRISIQHNQLENIIYVEENKGIIKHKNNLYANIEGKGIHILQDDKLKPVNVQKWVAEHELLFSIDFSNEYSLIGMNNNTMYLFNGETLKKITIESQSYLNENILIGAKELSKTLMVVSTLTGGCLLIDKNTGKTEQIINYHSGLPDNEISAIEPDKDKGLWLAHGQGLTRASLDNSVKNFSSYPGLEGYLISVIYYNQTLFAATSEGVYYLDEAKDNEEYKELILVSKEARRKSKHSFFGRNKASINKRLFPGLFSGKDKLKSKEEYTVYKPEEQISPLKTSINKNYIFRKSINFHGKCKQLLISENHLLALSNLGLYEIDKNWESKLILKNSEINIIYKSIFSNKIYAGLKNGLITLKFIDKEWKMGHEFNIKCSVLSLCEDSLRQLWISSTGKLLKLEFNKAGRQVQYQEFLLEEKSNENPIIQQIHGKIAFIFPSSVYKYNQNKDLIEKDSSFFSINNSETIVLSQANLTWHKYKETWIAMDATTGSKDFNIPLLSLFKDIKNIFLDEDKNLWIIDGKVDLYRIEKKYSHIDDLEFKLHIREITNDNGKLLSFNGLELDHTNKSLNFYLAAPHFLDESSIKYQYFLKGIMEDWSSWTSSSILKFPLLPSGEYHLQIRAKNVLGHVSEIKTIEFKIHPPFWKKNWFYVSEILFFSLLIILSILLNQKKKNFFLTKILAFVTLIIIIEFIHNLVSSVINVGVMDNPLMRLGADVLLALLISPIEKILEIVLFKRKRQIAQLAILYRKKILEYSNAVRLFP
jgi:hypothetical protein